MVKKILVILYVLAFLLFPLASVSFADTSGVWQTMAPSPDHMASNGMAYDGQQYIYVIGGFDDNFNYSNRFQRYNVNANTWESLPSLPIHMYGTQAFYTNGNIIVLAGDSPDSGAYTQFTGGAVLKYNIASATWSPLQAVEHDLNVGGAAFDGQRYIYATSILYSGYTTLRYDIQQNTWSQLPTPPVQTYEAVGICDGQGRYYLFGGFDNNNNSAKTNVVQRYDPLMNTWSTLPPAPILIAYGTGVYDGGDNVYITPGNNTSFYKYKISTDSWVQFPDQPTSTFINSSIWDGSGDVYITGGFDSNSSLSNGFYRFNTNPIVGAISVSTNPIQVNMSTSALATFTDTNTSATHTASWNWGDGTPTNPDTTTGTVTEPNGSTPGTIGADSHTYTTAGVYTVKLTVTNNNGLSGQSTFQYISAYNPTTQGLFSAGQRFSSPAGAYLQNPSLTGDVKFGLSYKYQGAMPVGDRQFSMTFNAANLTFNATTVNSLVIANSMATLTGTGTLNGSGTYNFLVTGSESANTIRVQITDLSNNVIYDTQPGAAATAPPTTALSAGHVLAH